MSWLPFSFFPSSHKAGSCLALETVGCLKRKNLYHMIKLGKENFPPNFRTRLTPRAITMEFVMSFGLLVFESFVKYGDQKAVSPHKYARHRESLHLYDIRFPLNSISLSCQCKKLVHSRRSEITRLLSHPACTCLSLFTRV